MDKSGIDAGFEFVVELPANHLELFPKLIFFVFDVMMMLSLYKWI
jgi:hypothetical protein